MLSKAARLGACDECSRIKQRCEGGEPCSRCSRLSVECQHRIVRNKPLKTGKTSSIQTTGPSDIISDHINDKTAPNGKPKRRATVIKRARTGCISCKQRRKKCDEALPRCGDCERLDLKCCRVCGTPGSSPEDQQIAPSPSRSSTTEEGILSIHTEESSLILEIQPSDLSAWSYRKDSVQGYESLSPSIESDESFNHLTNLIYTSPRPPCLSIPFFPPRSHYNLSGSQDQHLFRHFIRVVSRTLSTVHDDEENPFLTLIVPLAGSSKVVMESLLALSASHLRRLYPDILQKGLSHQSNALSSLNEIICGKVTGTPEETLGTVLLLCMIEICDGKSTKWSWHISAAQTIIRSKSKTKSSSTTWKFLLAMFGYVDSVITISKCQPPLISLKELAEDGGISDANHNSASRMNEAPYKSHNEALFGVAQPLFDMIGKISALANRRKDRVDEISEIWFLQSATAIEKGLREWEPDSGARFDEVSASAAERRSNNDIANAAQAIKWASILRLHQVVHGYMASDHCVAECTSHILTYISMVRFGSSAESILIFPLVMAAAGCGDDEQRIMVNERWLVMERTIGFDNIYQAREMVDAVWRAVDEGRKDGSNNGGLSVNWARIRHDEFPGVVLL